MKGKELINRLRTQLGVQTDVELASRLGITRVGLSLWKKSRRLTVRQVSNMIAGLEKRVTRPDRVIEAIRRKFGVDSDHRLAALIGITAPALHYWRRGSITPKRIANAVSSARRAGAREAEVGAIRPIVEFFPLDAVHSKRRANMDLFSTSSARKTHTYRVGLQNELKEHHGVYIFFDSRGRALYVGKAKQQSLWKEMTSAFNRSRQVQRVKRVEHPGRNVQYRTSNEMSRPIRPKRLPLCELAQYFSAYQVSDAFIGELESLLVRSFANDLLNVRMERFSHQTRHRQARRGKRARRRRART
jgi:DNA-binding transcriptional regulator YiaG